MGKAYLVFAQDMRGHFVIGKAFSTLSKAQEYETYLNDIGLTKPMGKEMRFIDDVEIHEIEIDEA